MIGQTQRRVGYNYLSTSVDSPYEAQQCVCGLVFVAWMGEKTRNCHTVTQSYEHWISLAFGRTSNTDPSRI